ncbi:transposase [Massilia putida]|uniref:transposase n=1 Tax=Massilia putida TaxID=1141883 RepID=UPI001E5756C9|nr:transposase [Massilia putida]
MSEKGGQRAYLYRVVGASGRKFDLWLSKRRDLALAKACFRKVVRSLVRAPATITLDGYSASHRAFRGLRQQGTLADLTKPPTQHAAWPDDPTGCPRRAISASFLRCSTCRRLPVRLGRRHDARPQRRPGSANCRPSCRVHRYGKTRIFRGRPFRPRRVP